MTTSNGRPFWIDSEYDTEHASDGVSRYGAYIWDRLDWFTNSGVWDSEEDIARVSFAVTAWRIATGPIMAPGYARSHRRVLRHDVEHSEWDGSLVACVDLITGWPQELQRSRDWRDRKLWRDWPTEARFASSDFVYVQPSGEDLVRASYLLASASLRFALPCGHLPRPPESWRALVDTARQAVAVLVSELNRVIGPVITTQEGGQPVI